MSTYFSFVYIGPGPFKFSINKQINTSRVLTFDAKISKRNNFERAAKTRSERFEKKRLPDESWPVSFSGAGGGVHATGTRRRLARFSRGSARNARVIVRRFARATNTARLTTDRPAERAPSRAAPYGTGSNFNWIFRFAGSARRASSFPDRARRRRSRGTAAHSTDDRPRYERPRANFGTDRKPVACGGR